MVAMIAFIKKSGCCLLFFCAIIRIANAQTTPFVFNHLTLYNSQRARTLMRDSRGYLWIGSDGLFRFDGIGTKRYIHDPKNSNSLVNNIVKNIVEDKKGRIWIATIKGVSCYDLATDSFTNYEHEEGDLKHPRKLR
jgi:ligand-binding sensor domain-containing protein